MDLDGFHAALRRAPEGPLGVAVSGGSDSVALLLLARAAVGPARLRAVTVDHGLRPEAAAEARAVAEIAQRLGIAHETLRWRERDGRGNLPDRARRARYALMAGWAGAEGLGAVLLGHTRDDVAEGVVMRLQRGAGLAGLAAMREEIVLEGMTFLRPLLWVGRAELRAVLRARGVAWHDDPSNDDPRYDRARVRGAFAGLADLGLGAESLADTAQRLRATETGLRHLLADWCRCHSRVRAGDVLIDRAALEALPSDPARRILAAAILFVTGREYPPRARDALRVLEAVDQGRRTLHGCLIGQRGDAVVIGREPDAALRAATVPVGEVWDRRWRVIGPTEAGIDTRAVGPVGLNHYSAWRTAGLTREAAMVSPAVWRGDTPIAAPLIDGSGPYEATFIRDDFPTSVVSH